MKAILWRLKNLSLFVRAYISGLLHSTRNHDLTGDPKKIVIIQGARLGDMVCTTPVFRAIKKKYPTTHITVVGDAVNEKLLAGHPDVDRYIVWKNNFRDVVRTLREEKIDFGMVCLPSLEGLALLLLSRLRLIVAPKISGGTSPYETTTYKRLLRFVSVVPHHFDCYVPREYLRLLEPIGITTDNTSKHLTFSADASERVKRLLAEEGVEPGQKLVGILPGVGGDALKLWAPEKFAAIADYVFQKYGACPILLGSGKDAGAVEATIAALSPTTETLNLLDKLSIEGLKALIASLFLFISADTGPMYIAEAFSTPTIDILGPVKEFVQPPRGPLHKIVMAPRETGALGVLDNIPRDVEEARRQSDDITVEMVTRTIDELVPQILSRDTIVR